MPKTIKEFQLNQSTGEVSVEYSDDSTSKFNAADMVTAQTNPVTGGVRLSAGGSDVLASSSLAPKIYKSSLGPIARLSALGAGCAVGAGGKIYALSNTAVPYVYDSAMRTWASYSAIPSGSNTAKAMFVDSRGYIFLCTVGGGKVWRSTDGGQTYSVVYTWAFSDEDTLSFTEDDQGTLWTHAYSHATKSVQLIKSTDGGATWTDIASTAHVYVSGSDSGTLQSLVNRHIHCVHWCKYRGWLFVTHGDAGSQSPVLVSTDRGATFQAWGNFTAKNVKHASQQATVILTDKNAIYYRADTGVSVNDANDDFGVYRTLHAAGESISALLAAAPVKMWHETFGSAGRAIDGWSSAGGITSDGVIWFNSVQAQNYSGKVIASGDGGATWSEIYTTTAATGGAFGSFAFYRAYISDYYTGQRDDLMFGTANDETIFGFRLLPYYRQAHKYDGDLSAQWLPSSAYTNKLYVDFETLPTPNSSNSDTGTANDLASTGPGGAAFLGTKCGKFTLTGTGSYANAQWNNLLNGLPDGSELVIEGRVYIDAASVTGNLNLITFAGGSGNVVIGCNSGRAIRVSGAGALNWGSAVASAKEQLLPVQKWTWLRAVVMKHATAGEITVLIDGKVAFRVIGVPTRGDDLYQVNIGAVLGGGYVANVYWDSVAAWTLTAPSVPTRIEAGSTF